MQEYVCGFMFDKSFIEGEKEVDVLLIRKEKPSWQYGMLNGVGGKIEEGETPYQAMSREFKEEVGIDTVAHQWDDLCSISSKDWKVYFMISHGDIGSYKQMEKEVPEIVLANTIGDRDDIIPNLKWLIPMALHDCETYEIKEL